MLIKSELRSLQSVPLDKRLYNEILKRSTEVEVKTHTAEERVDRRGVPEFGWGLGGGEALERHASVKYGKGKQEKRILKV